MATITSLETTDNGADSRTTINTNFGNLNTDKLENINSESIADLSDVDSIAGITDGKILKWDTNKFVLADDDDTTYEKASGSELDTGTNDTKYATAKALDDSEYKKSSELKNSQSTADASSITPTGDYPENEHYVTALEQALTINAPSGTASNGNTLMIRIKDDGTTRSLTWNSAYTWIGTTEPEDTTASKVLYVGAIYNSTSEKWEVLSVVEED